MTSNSNTLHSNEEHPYRFEHFDIRIIADDLRFSGEALRPGQHLPNVPVSNIEGEQVSLYSLCQEKPLLLMTGSITCPMTISSFPTLKKLQEKLGDKVDFALLYVREAHPAEYYPQPHSIAQKAANATDLKERYNIDCKVIIDDIDGTLHHALDVMPNSAHLIGERGEILFQSLWVSDTPTLERAVTELAEGKPISKKVSERMFTPFLRGAGYMHDTFRLAGDRSYRELAFGAPPIALLAKTASFWSVLPKKYRGLAAVLSLASLGTGLLYTLLMF